MLSSSMEQFAINLVSCDDPSGDVVTYELRVMIDVLCVVVFVGNDEVHRFLSRVQFLHVHDVIFE